VVKEEWQNFLGFAHFDFEAELCWRRNCIKAHRPMRSYALWIPAGRRV
jgi:hypothetical protein